MSLNGSCQGWDPKIKSRSFDYAYRPTIPLRVMPIYGWDMFGGEYCLDIITVQQQKDAVQEQKFTVWEQTREISNEERRGCFCL